MNCERSEQEGKFLFATLWLSSKWFDLWNLYVFYNQWIKGAFNLLAMEYGAKMCLKNAGFVNCDFVIFYNINYYKGS